MTKTDLDVLLYRHMKQFPNWPSTCNKCTNCDRTVVGTGLCACCLEDELLKAGASQDSINELRDLYCLWQATHSKIEEVKNKIKSEVMIGKKGVV